MLRVPLNDLLSTSTATLSLGEGKKLRVEGAGSRGHHGQMHREIQTQQNPGALDKHSAVRTAAWWVQTRRPCGHSRALITCRKPPRACDLDSCGGRCWYFPHCGPPDGTLQLLSLSTPRPVFKKTLKIYPNLFMHLDFMPNNLHSQTYLTGPFLGFLCLWFMPEYLALYHKNAFKSTEHVCVRDFSDLSGLFNFEQKLTQLSIMRQLKGFLVHSWCLSWI